jgi:hypothetical protein
MSCRWPVFVIRLLIPGAALQIALDPHRISFTHVMCVLQDTLPEFQFEAHAQYEQLFAYSIQDAAARLLSPRWLRVNQRVVKRKMSSFRLKRPNQRPVRRQYDLGMR